MPSVISNPYHYFFNSELNHSFVVLTKDSLEMLEFIKRDTNRTGIVAAIVVPSIIFITALLLMSGTIKLVNYVQTMLIFGTFSKILSLCVYPNLIIFYLYLHFDRNRSAKGVVWGTMIMASIVLVIYLIQQIY